MLASRSLLLLTFVAVAASACVQGQRASDTGDPGFPFGPTTIGVQPIAYAQDIKPIFDRATAGERTRTLRTTSFRIIWP